MNHTKILLGLICILAIMISCNSNQLAESDSINYSQDQIDSLKRIECNSIFTEMREMKADTFLRVNSIPLDLENSLLVLDSMMNPKMKEWIVCLPDGEFSGFVHHGLGTHLRNNWGLWGGSALPKSLNKIGIFHPDDMSGIILDSYQRKMKGEEIRLDEQVKQYQDFWKKNSEPVDSVLVE